METVFQYIISVLEMRFKSYYVVWKPTYTFPAGSGMGEFKSYYVVWKLDGPGKYFEAKGEFKSYYVVWKQEVVAELWVFFSYV